MTTVSKQEAEYIDVSPDYQTRRCYVCTMYRVPNKCTLVRGKISPEGVCKWFELDARFQVNVEPETEQVEKRGSTMPGMKMYLPITKVDRVNRLVYGIATEERPDHAKEILDYEKSKPYFIAWSDSIAKATEGKSVGNLRAMHGKTVAGKFTEMTFNDAHKRIEVCGKVVDDGEWKKVEEGCYTGFSIGGRYVDRYTDPSNSAYKRYVADPSEISLVDIPCLPTATFQMVKSIASGVEEIEVRTFKTISDEAGVEEAFQKFLTEPDPESEPDPAAATTTTTAMAEASQEDLSKATHQPGREASAVGELPTEGASGDNRQATQVTGGDDAHLSATQVDPGTRNKEVEGDPHSFEPKTREGNPDNVEGGLNSDKGTGSPGGSSNTAGVSKTDDPSTTSTSTTPTAGDPRDALRQVWKTSDGKFFDKKADATAHEEELRKEALVKQVADPALSTLEQLNSVLDRIDGGSNKISDLKAYENAYKAAISGQQTRSGFSPLGKIYNSVDELPDSVKQHFTDANKRRQWMHVWNSVFKESGDEQKAFAQAWSAAEKGMTDEAVEKKRQGSYGNVTYADPGHQKDGKPRYPVDTEKHIKAAWSYIHMPKNAGKYSSANLAAVKSKIVEAWKSKIDSEGPPSASKVEGADFIKLLGVNLSKHLYDVGDVACTILQLNRLRENLEMEAVREGDMPELADELRQHISAMCQFLRNLVTEETEELVMGTEDLTGYDDDDGGDALAILVRAAVGPNAAYLGKVLQDTVGKQEDDIEKLWKEKGPNYVYTKSPAVKLIAALQKVGQKMGQVNRMHLQAAHDHVSAMTDGECCDMGDTEKWTKAGAKLSKETRDHLKGIHDKMSELGADCAMSKAILFRHTEGEIGEFEKSMGFGPGTLEKLANENVSLRKAYERLEDGLKKALDRIEQIAKTPEPARGLRAVQPNTRIVEKDGVTSVQYNQGGNGNGRDSELEKFTEWLDSLPEDQKTLELIKLAQRNPVVRVR